MVRGGGRRRLPVGDDRAVDLGYQLRGEIIDEELLLLTRSHGGRPSVGWWDGIRPYSLGWICARQGDGSLIGFVNVAWDGGDHAFLLDPKVPPDHQCGFEPTQVKVPGSGVA